MNRTKIEYLDLTWNPIVGCSGKGCAVRANCWAKRMAKRQKHRCQKCYDFIPHYHIERWEQPFSVKKPSRIGVTFMGDFFDEYWKSILGTTLQPQRQLLAIMERAYWHTFIILTKQPQNIPFRYFPPNIWLGVTVNTRADTWRISELLRHNCEVHIVSAEPLYEPLDGVSLQHIEWLIIGAQTRPNIQPQSEWINNLIVEAKRHKAAVFLKNNIVQPYPLLQEFPKTSISSGTTR